MQLFRAKLRLVGVLLLVAMMISWVLQKIFFIKLFSVLAMIAFAILFILYAIQFLKKGEVGSYFYKNDEENQL